MTDLVVPSSPPGSSSLSPGRVRAWRAVQLAVWLVGVGVFLALIFWPKVGLHALWNVLIPIAPALIVFAVGLWRNICPLGTTALLPRHLGLSRRRHLSVEWQGRLALTGTLLLLLVVPLRHVVLDQHGPSAALVIGVLAIGAVTMGLLFEWKSGWCSGLCPVHPVEQLYGQWVAVSVPNAHCGSCHRCVSVCPDSTPGVHPLLTERPWTRRVAGLLLAGGFVGYVIGWFLVPDYAQGEGWSRLGLAYGLPGLGLATSLVLFLGLRAALPRRHQRLLISLFAGAAVAAYYWFRLPMLFGFGRVPGVGTLVDLRGTLPSWFPWLSRAATTLLFGWWFARVDRPRRAWGMRPPFADPALA